MTLGYFINNPNDRELKRLANLMVCLAAEDDVRHVKYKIHCYSVSNFNTQRLTPGNDIDNMLSEFMQRYALPVSKGEMMEEEISNESGMSDRDVAEFQGKEQADNKEGHMKGLKFYSKFGDFRMNKMKNSNLASKY